MDGFLILLLLVVLGIPLGFVVVFSRIRKINQVLERLSGNMDYLYRRTGGEEPKRSKPPESVPEVAPETVPEDAPASPPIAAEAVESRPVAQAEPRSGAMAPAPPPARATAPAPAARSGKSFEQRFTERWMVWLGGIALALGGTFLVKYTIDEGLLGPGVRIALGVLAAAAMVGLGEWLRHNGALPKAMEGMLEEAPDYVPSALTAAGIFTAFATIYAAHVLYAMIPGIAAFALLALVSFAGMALALVHGPLLAFLGLVGAYAVPILVTIGEPSAATLFPYLLAVTAGALEVVRYRRWRHLALAALGISTLWVALWYTGPGGAADALYVSLFGLALAALYLLRLYPGSDPAAPGDDSLPWHALGRFPFWRLVTVAGAASGAFAIFAGADLAGHASEHFLVAALFAALSGWVARRDGRLDILLAGAGALVFLLLANWYIPHTSPTDAEMATEAATWAPLARPFVPLEYQTLAITGASLAILFLGGGFAGLWGARRPGFWAAISAVVPLSITILIYWRIHNYAPSLGWTFTSLALGALFLMLGERTARYRGQPGMNDALGAYAVGVTAAVALAFAMLLENAWLTVALALQLPAIAWVWKRLDVSGLRTTALVLAGIVLARLALNPYTLDYAISGSIPGVNWLLYGYGLPAIAFFIANRWFECGEENRLEDVLAAGALIFAFLLVTLELRSVMSESGSLTGSYTFAERAIQSVNWLGFSLLLLRLEGRKRRAFYTWMRYALMAVLLVNILLYRGLWEVLSPGVAVGPWPVFNLLLLAYGIPGVMALYLYRAAKSIAADRPALLYGIGGLVLIFVWLNFEVRHAFHGSNLGVGPETDGEAYAYSIAWLAYSGALLAGGLWRGTKALRHASLAVLMLAILKVFFFDLGQLEGLWRALSFLGLGAVLVGIGYLYRRYVFPPAPIRDQENPA